MRWSRVPYKVQWLLVNQLIILLDLFIALRWYQRCLTNSKTKNKMKAIIAISGNTKVTVLTGLTSAVAAKLRRNLVQAEENFDMFGHEICRYRLKKV